MNVTFILLFRIKETVRGINLARMEKKQKYTKNEWANASAKRLLHHLKVYTEMHHLFVLKPSKGKNSSPTHTPPLIISNTVHRLSVIQFFLMPAEKYNSRHQKQS